MLRRPHLQRTLVENFIRRASEAEPESVGHEDDGAGPRTSVQARRFIKMVENRRRQILHRALADES